MNTSLVLDYKLKPISFEKLNDEFSLMRCYVMALGKNRNYTHFSKDSVDDALPTLYNIPVVAHLKKRQDGGWYVGGHDRRITIDDDGITTEDLTVPFGVVPESCNPEYIDVIEESGKTAKYLVANIILWSGRYPELMEAKSPASEDIYFNQSMEITLKAWEEYAEDKNYTDIKKFSFSALCLLGRDPDHPEYNTTPCFPSARVEPLQYHADKFKEEFALMLSELNKFAFNFSSTSKKEDEKLLNEKLEIIAKYGLTVDKLDFKIEDISIEDIEAKLKSYKHDITKQTFAATYRQKREALSNALDSEIVRDSDGNIIEETYYWVEDFNDQYVFVEKSHWTADGNYDRTYGRFSYLFDEENVVATITGDWEEMYLMWLTAEEKANIDLERNEYEQIKAEFDSYKEEYKTKESEVEELRTFKTTTLKAQRDAEVEAIFAKFDEKLANNEEYKALKEKSDEYELDVLTDRCFAILGKCTVDFSLNTKEPLVLGVDNVEVKGGPYGGLFEVYGQTESK